MTLIQYVGPHDAVDVPDAGLENLKRGKPVEVDDKVAASLLEQDTWQRVKRAAAASKRAASKRAAPKRAAVKSADENTEG